MNLIRVKCLIWLYRGKKTTFRSSNMWPSCNIGFGYEQGRQCSCNVTLRPNGATIFAMEKQISITYSNCVWVCVCVALVMQHVMRRHRTKLSSVSCLAVSYSFKLSYINGMIFRGKKVTEHKCAFFIFSTTFVWNMYHSEKNWARYYHKCMGLRVKYWLFSLDFNEI